jgi:hypothetical protein
MNTANDLINRYYDWLKAKTNWREINGWLEITTPYLDRHNDYIQIYLEKRDNEWILTDDGYTLADLAQSGCEIDTPHRKALLTTTLNGFGVQEKDDTLEIKTTETNFPLHKHNLVQAILAVNDMFYVARTNVENFFFEDVALWLDNSDIRYIPRVKFTGHSTYEHQFDFVIPKSKREPERIIRIINNPNKDNAQNFAFAWMDTNEDRPEGSQAFALLNDRDRKIGDSVRVALSSYDIITIPWSQRDTFKNRLAA